jgi:hypothetical protein
MFDPNIALNGAAVGGLGLKTEMIRERDKMTK